MEGVTCPICGEVLPNRMRLGSHMWTAHKTKLKEYEAKQNAIYESHSVDGLIKPGVVTESTEFVTETKKANDGLVTAAQPVQDKDIVVPPVQTETVQQPSQMLNEDALIRRAMPNLDVTSVQETVLPEAKPTAQIMSRPAAQPARREMSADYNPYREMYNDNGGDVMNEFLGRSYGR